MSWKVVSCSAIGTSHQKRQTPCQDYASYYCTDSDIFIGAVADGAGSAKYSNIGARIAVNDAIEFIRRNDWCFQPKVKANYEQFLEGNYYQELFKFLIREVIITSLQKEASQKKYLLDDLACTLLIVVAHPKWIVAMQIGDGLIVLKSTNQDRYHLLFMPDRGEYVNETTFVTSGNVIEQIQVDFQHTNIQFVCIATDGIENISLDKTANLRWQPFEGFFIPLQDELAKTKNTNKLEKEINDFLSSDRVNKKTNDDKTLLSCTYETDSSQVSRNKLLEKAKLTCKISPQNIADITNNIYKDSFDNNDFFRYLLSNPPQTNVNDNREPIQSITDSSNKKQKYKQILLLLFILFIVGSSIFINLYLLIKNQRLLNLENAALQTLKNEKYIFPLYILNDSNSNPVGFLIKKTEVKTIEAWVYVQESYINHDQKTITILDDATPITFLYPELILTGKELAITPIGFIYPGTYSFDALKLSLLIKGRRKYLVKITLNTFN